MRTRALTWDAKAGWRPSQGDAISPNLVIYFGSRAALSESKRYEELRALYPSAHLMGCTTGGQISGAEVEDDRITATAIQFDTTRIAVASETIGQSDESQRCGETIGRKLAAPDLSGLFVLSDGLHVNGSELVAGINSQVGDIPVTGGLAGDGSSFVQTLVGVDSQPTTNTVAAVGFYGDTIRIGHGSAGGWDVFGPRRLITRSKGNVLLELDGEPALALYERYLGEDEIKGLPGSALLFPLQVFNPQRPDHTVVRTVLAVDRDSKSMTFAGDVPEGWAAQLMRGNFGRLAEGAATAARQAREGLVECKDRDGVAILVSCIGRRLLMGQRIIEEVEAAGDVLGPRLPYLGFYSYGEISPHAQSGICELHNQTMTVTTLTEAA
ncbi:MAG: FIST signal transduction protein [Pseudolabrys sp.]